MRPSCFSASLKRASSSRLFGLPDVLDDLRELLLAERVPRFPAALDQQQLVDGARIRSGVICAIARCSSGLAVPAFASSGRLRSSATWRASNSVFVMISPFTLTSTCSTISARSGIVAARAARHGGDHRLLQHNNPLNINILLDVLAT